MDLKPKYTKDDWVEYEIDGSMFIALAELDKEQTDEVLLQMDTYEECLPVKNEQTQTVGGIISHETPFFFELTYMKQEGEMTIFLEITETDCDTYLDYKKHHATVIWSLSNFDNIVSQDRILNTKYHICALEFRNNEDSIFLFNEQELRAEIVDLKKSLSFLKRENKYLHSLRIEQKPYEGIISLLKSRVPPTQTGSFKLKLKALVNGL